MSGQGVEIDPAGCNLGSDCLAPVPSEFEINPDILRDPNDVPMNEGGAMRVSLGLALGVVGVGVANSVLLTGCESPVSTKFPPVVSEEESPETTPPPVVSKESPKTTPHPEPVPTPSLENMTPEDRLTVAFCLWLTAVYRWGRENDEAIEENRETWERFLANQTVVLTEEVSFAEIMDTIEPKDLPSVVLPLGSNIPRASGPPPEDVTCEEMKIAMFDAFARIIGTNLAKKQIRIPPQSMSTLEHGRVVIRGKGYAWEEVAFAIMERCRGEMWVVWPQWNPETDEIEDENTYIRWRLKDFKLQPEHVVAVIVTVSVIVVIVTQPELTLGLGTLVFALP